MFNNFVNARDIRNVLSKSGKIPSILSGLISGKRQRVKDAWAHAANPPTNWWDIPEVPMRWNQLVSGSADVGYREYISQKWLAGRERMHALSLGCGGGHNELAWIKLGKFEGIDAYDVSEQRIKSANKIAVENGYGQQLHYKVGDVFGIEMKENFYDVILVEHSLHHFSPLEQILLRIEKFLKPDGYFVVNEFVGPTRFQWSDRQLAVVNGLLAALPAKYKKLWQSDTVKFEAVRPSRLSMILSDPSEAVESAKIMPLLNSIFDVVELRVYGGNIVHLLFNGIAHNFRADDAETKHYLDLIFRTEDMLLASGEVQSDFVVAVCRKKVAGTALPI